MFVHYIIRFRGVKLLHVVINVVMFTFMDFSGRMAGVNGDRKGKKDDNGIGTAIDFMLSNAKLVLGVGGAAMLGIATLAVKRVRIVLFCFLLSSHAPPLVSSEMTCARVFVSQMYDRAISAPTSPTKMEQSGKRSWEEPAWMGSSPRVLNSDMKSTVSRSLQSLPTSSRAFEPGAENTVVSVRRRTALAIVDRSDQWLSWLMHFVSTDTLFGGILLFFYSGW